MLGIDNFLLFLSTGILLNLYPGPDSMYIISRSVSQGRLAGIFAVLGISTGAFFHTVIGAVGFSAIILSSARAFMFIKYAGALYLLYQAVLMMKDSFKQTNTITPKAHKGSMLKIYKQGALTNILNPKVALFFMALLPQFISPAAPYKSVAFFVLGLAFITTGTLWCLGLAIFASYFTKKMRKSSNISKWLLRANGSLFALLGIQLATSDPR